MDASESHGSIDLNERAVADTSNESAVPLSTKDPAAMANHVSQAVKTGDDMPAPLMLHRKKPLLATSELIDHLKTKGVTFDLVNEEDAAGYISTKTYYFKIAAYRALFQKRVGGERDGQYVGLDFGHLVKLASVDRTMRYTLLPMTLDVEHFAHAKLLHRVETEPGEDGYSIVADYMASLNHDNRRRRLAEISMLEPDAYCGDLVRKYRAHMPVWAFLELISFGSFIDFYLFCANRWQDPAMEDEHYMLRQVKAARNAAAHSSNIVNGFGAAAGGIATNDSVSAAIAGAGISKRVRASKMRNPRLQQIATLLYVHTRLVPEGTSKDRARADLMALTAEMEDVLADLAGNDAIRSSFDFLMTLFKKWF